MNPTSKSSDTSPAPTRGSHTELPSVSTITVHDLRGAAYGAQCLVGEAQDPVDALVRGGYVRTLGGVDVYLALRARVPGVTRGRVDDLVQEGRLCVVPTVRGCIYLVPQEDVAVSLHMADALSKRRREREYAKVEIGEGELARVGEAVLTCLQDHGPTTTVALRPMLPEGVIRSLGDLGKKVGMSSTLPPALRELEFCGRIRRRPVGGRLDAEKYEWIVGDSLSLPSSVEATHDHMARVFFRAAGYAPFDQFAEWSGLGKREARGAADRVGVSAAQVADVGPFLGFADGTSAAGAGVAFLPFQDNLIQLQGGPRNLVNPAHWDIPVPKWGRGKGETLGTARHMAFRSIALDGELVGFWEFDPQSGEVVTFCFASAGKGAGAAIKAEAADTAQFIREDLGHGRSFSIDTEKDLARRAGEIRRMR